MVRKMSLCLLSCSTSENCTLQASFGPVWCYISLLCVPPPPVHDKNTDEDTAVKFILYFNVKYGKLSIFTDLCSELKLGYLSAYLTTCDFLYFAKYPLIYERYYFYHLKKGNTSNKTYIICSLKFPWEDKDAIEKV